MKLSRRGFIKGIVSSIGVLLGLKTIEKIPPSQYMPPKDILLSDLYNPIYLEQIDIDWGNTEVWKKLTEELNTSLRRKNFFI